MKVQSHLLFVLALGSLASYPVWSAENADLSGNVDQGSTFSSAYDANSSADMELGRGGGHGGGGHGGHGGGHGGGGFHGGHSGGHGGGGFHGGHGGGYHGGHGGWGHGGHYFHDPVIIRGGYGSWPHWGHPFFARPIYDWEWDSLRLVTCTAEDSDGDEYPVTEEGYVGITYRDRMDQVEDAALDRCYSETDGDTSCVLLDCTPGY